MARGALDALWPQSREVRSFFDEIVEGKREAMPAYSCHDVEGAVAVGLAWSMALNDRWTVGKLDPLARQALDRMWTLQRDDGSWQWPFRDTPPLKVREHYGVTLAAIAAGMAPDGYAQTPAAKAGLEGIRKYLCATHPISMHEKAMLLWASVYVDRLLTREAQEQITRDLMSAQRPDGGWSVASLVDNTDDPSLARSAEALKLKAEPGYGTQFLIYAGRDGVYKSSLVPDGYATGLVIFVARQVGLPAADEKLGRGIAWLKSHQRQSGRWFTPSQSWHTQNLISNAGSAYAILALEACQDPSKP
jgi:squalene-hopene/tetraprenyl-beta-curcumene cyclase